MTRPARHVRALLSASAILLLVSCINDPTQRVAIRTDPPGARALILPDGTEVTTPAEVTLEREHPHTVLLTLEGYCPERVYLDRMLSPVSYLLTSPSLARGEGASGAGYRLAPEAIGVSLRPTDETDADGCRP